MQSKVHNAFSALTFPIVLPWQRRQLGVIQSMCWKTKRKLICLVITLCSVFLYIVFSCCCSLLIVCLFVEECNGWYWFIKILFAWINNRYDHLAYRWSKVLNKCKDRLSIHVYLSLAPYTCQTINLSCLSVYSNVYSYLY